MGVAEATWVVLEIRVPFFSVPIEQHPFKRRPQKGTLDIKKALKGP